MAGELVLVTGANGHVGFRVVVRALEAGYSVRAAVRSQEKADHILSLPSIKALNPGDRLTTVVFSDLTQPGALDAAFQGVDYVIHVASPMFKGVEGADLDAAVVQPAVAVTRNVLTAALKCPSVRRVVITSSMIAMLSWYEMAVLNPVEKLFDETSRAADPLPPYDFGEQAYAASKVLALNFAERWVGETKPHFGVVHVHPAVILGDDEAAVSVEAYQSGSNRVVLDFVVGEGSPYPQAGSVALLDDVALAHVKALDATKIPDGQSLIVTAGGIDGIQYSDVIDIVKAKFPEEVKSGLLPCQGNVTTKTFKVDASRSEKLLGFKPAPLETQVVSAIEGYLRLKRAGAA